MALPGYNKDKRRKTFQQLPKGAYVITIKNAREEPNKNGNGSHLTIAFDIAEGEHARFFENQFKANTNEDKKWPNDGLFYLTVPTDGCQEYIWTNWNTFFADLEDSNGGFIFGGDPTTLKGKLIGGKFAIEQNEYNGRVYDHTKLRWTCVAEDVRTGNAGTMPKDKLIGNVGGAPMPQPDSDGFMSLPDGIDEEFPF